MVFLNKLLKRKTTVDSTENKKESLEKKNKIREVAPVVIKEIKTKEAKVEKGEKNTKKNKISVTSTAHLVLSHPLVTEKSATAESENKYSFVVAKWATKERIKQAISEMYGVEPVTVNTANYQGRLVKFKGLTGKRKDYKKAIVTLPKGKTIDIHKGV